MSYFIKPIFELITGELILFKNIYYNYIAIAIILFIAYKIAYRIVGRIYDEGLISGKGIGSIFHWIIRMIVFSIIFFLFSAVIWLVNFFIVH